MYKLQLLQLAFNFNSVPVYTCTFVNFEHYCTYACRHYWQKCPQKTQTRSGTTCKYGALGKCRCMAYVTAFVIRSGLKALIMHSFCREFLFFHSKGSFSFSGHSLSTNFFHLFAEPQIKVLHMHIKSVKMGGYIHVCMYQHILHVLFSPTLRYIDFVFIKIPILIFIKTTCMLGSM